uniref:Uncharacterized protein n=1 Tax=Hemiselmis andersenii TaxID=464988 RepID=A0A6U2C773_HEMAN|mmetsp:Transcript_18659/g.43124  ORF Transcript_18659/g.43124 Transcript_18659/m.43124 type:complete len:144 (-) Transcript_18659:46-477(-)
MESQAENVPIGRQPSQSPLYSRFYKGLRRHPFELVRGGVAGAEQVVLLAWWIAAPSTLWLTYKGPGSNYKLTPSPLIFLDVVAGSHSFDAFPPTQLNAAELIVCFCIVTGLPNSLALTQESPCPPVSVWCPLRRPWSPQMSVV